MTNIDLEKLLVGSFIVSIKPDYFDEERGCSRFVVRFSNGEEFAVESVAMHGMDSRVEIVYKGEDVTWISQPR